VQNPVPASLKTVFIAAFLIVPGVWPIFGQELLGNGDFEDGRLVPWNVKQSPGGSVALVTQNSPFNTVYPTGTSSVQLKDDDSSDFVDQPSIEQPFTAQTAILFGFDFKMPNPGDASPWYVAWNGENDTTGFFFRLGGADGLSIEFNLQKVADLKANVWYHIEGFADVVNQKVIGTISNTSGDSATFDGGFPFGVKNNIDSVVVSDGDAARNPDVLLDNFYSRPVTLQIASNSKGEQVISWFGTGFTLQSTTTLGSAAQWTSIPGAQGSYTNTFSDPARFFRLTR
jgi:hypothetical protein